MDASVRVSEGLRGSQSGSNGLYRLPAEGFHLSDQYWCAPSHQSLTSGLWHYFWDDSPPARWVSRFQQRYNSLPSSSSSSSLRLSPVDLLRAQEATTPQWNGNPYAIPGPWLQHLRCRGFLWRLREGPGPMNPMLKLAFSKGIDVLGEEITEKILGALKT